ncbi:MAG: aconitate hydratase, partial [Clostridia bacterium]|nr:aconitate hydratase [Clostridia bacterium]
CFTVCDKDCPERAKSKGGGVILGGSNYGQGSSREHAALVPLYLGVKAVVAKSFARIHAANLINSGILPLTFENEADYDRIEQGDELEIPGIRKNVEDGTPMVLINKTKGIEIPLTTVFTDRQKKMILAGGLLNATKNA